MAGGGENPEAFDYETTQSWRLGIFFVIFLVRVQRYSLSVPQEGRWLNLIVTEGVN